MGPPQSAHQARELLCSFNDESSSTVTESEQLELDPYGAAWLPDCPDLVLQSLEEEITTFGYDYQRGSRGKKTELTAEWGGASLLDALAGRPKAIRWRVVEKDHGTRIELFAIYQRRVASFLRLGYFGILVALAISWSLPLITWARDLTSLDPIPGATLNLAFGIILLLAALWWGNCSARTKSRILELEMGLQERGFRFRVLESRQLGFARLPFWIAVVGPFIAIGLGLSTMLLAYGWMDDLLLSLAESPLMLALLLAAVGLSLLLRSFQQIDLRQNAQLFVWVTDLLGRLFPLLLLSIPLAIRGALRLEQLQGRSSWTLVVGACVWLFCFVGFAKGLSILQREEQALKKALQSKGEDIGRWVAVRSGGKLRNLALGITFGGLSLLFWTVSSRAMFVLVTEDSVVAWGLSVLALLPLGVHCVLLAGLILRCNALPKCRRCALPNRLREWASRQGLPPSRIPDLAITAEGTWTAAYVIERIWPQRRSSIFVRAELVGRLQDEEREALLAHELGHALLHYRLVVRDIVLAFVLWSSPGALRALANMAKREREADEMALNYCRETFGSGVPLRRALAAASLLSLPATNMHGAGGHSFLTLSAWKRPLAQDSLWRRWWTLMRRSYRSGFLCIHPPYGERLRALEQARAREIAKRSR